MQQQCFVSLKARTIVDLLNAAGRGRYGNYTLAETRERYPDAEQMEVGQALAQVEAQYISEPAPITEAQFTSALGCLPPEGRRITGNDESFKLCEYTYGKVTAIYVRVGETYWTFKDYATRTHAECVAKVKTVSSQGS